MNNHAFTEKDWKLFRSKIADWQEAFMDKLNKEYIELLSRDDDPSEKFWTLDKRIKEDKKKAGVMINIARSNLIDGVISLIYEGAISLDDLDEFSDQFKGSIAYAPIPVK